MGGLILAQVVTIRVASAQVQVRVWGLGTKLATSYVYLVI